MVPSVENNGSASRTLGVWAKTVLITGGAGFIGSNFVRYIFGKYPRYKIVIYDALTYAGNLDNIPLEIRESDRFEFIYGNVTNGAQVASVMPSADIVVHFAAESHVTRSIYDAADFLATDVIGTAVLAGAACKENSKVERFIQISTSEVYGSCRGTLETMDEEHPLEPCSPYASAKTGADRIIYSYWRTYGLPAVIVRPFNNYGPRQHLEKCIARFITSAIMNEPLTVHGQGLSSRDWVHVEDTCRALDAIMHAPIGAVVGQVFNVATGEDTNVLQLAKTIAALGGRSPEDMIEFIGERPGQVEKHRGNASKLTALTGWRPTVLLADGLAKTYEWYEKNESFWRGMLWMRKIRIRVGKEMEWH